MPTMINRGKEIIRICPQNVAKLEFSMNGGKTWLQCFSGNSTTRLSSDLMNNGTAISGTTSTGLFFARKKGRTWLLRKR